MNEITIIKLNATLRGHTILASTPDARYRRYHCAFVEIPPDASTVGDAEVVRRPAREHCSASTSLSRGGSYCDPIVGPGFLQLSGRLVCPWMGNGSLPGDDPEAAAVLAELASLDAAWLTQNDEACRAEDHRTMFVARAHALDDLPETPREVECLECGAVYGEPGHVESGGMSCDRCAT